MTGMQMTPEMAQTAQQKPQQIKNGNKPVTRQELFEMMQTQPARPAMPWLGSNG